MLEYVTGKTVLELLHQSPLCTQVPENASDLKVRLLIFVLQAHASDLTRLKINKQNKTYRFLSNSMSSRVLSLLISL